MEFTDLTPDHLHNWLTAGKTGDLSPIMVEYLERLDLVRSLYSKYESQEFIIRTLMTINCNLTRKHCQKIIADSLNFFYADNAIKKEAWRNIYAEKLDNAAMVCWEDNDMAGYRKNILAAMIARGLNQPDVVQLPPDLLDRRLIIYQPDASKQGIKPVERKELAGLIHQFNLTKAQKNKILYEANIDDVEYLEEPDAEDNS